MASWNQCKFDGWKSYQDDPCPYYDDPTFGKIVDMLPRERYVHHVHPSGSIILLYAVVKIDIGVIS